MDKWNNIKYFYFKYWLGILDKKQFLDWINPLLKNTKEDLQEIYPHINFSKNNIENSIKNIVQMLYPNFEIHSNEGQNIAKLITIEYSRKYLDKKIMPFEFCKLINQLDANFLEQSDWLGNLWNECDYCDETWTHLNSETLNLEVKNNLDELI